MPLFSSGFRSGLNAFFGSPAGGAFANLLMTPGSMRRWRQYNAGVGQNVATTQAVSESLLGPIGGQATSGFGQQPFAAPLRNFGRRLLGFNPVAGSFGDLRNGIQIQAQPDVPAEPSALDEVRDVAGRAGKFAEDYFDPNATADRFNQQLGGVAAGYEAIPGQFQGQTADINQGYQDRLQRARALAGQAAQQERIDVNRQFDALGSQRLAGLQQRGLSGSTVTGSATLANERERADALGRLNDRVTNLQLGVEGQFGGDALGALERSRGFGLSSQLASLGGRGQIGLAGFDAQNAAAIQRFNAMIAAGMLPPEFQLQASGLTLGSLPQYVPPQANFGRTLPNY